MNALQRDLKRLVPMVEAAGAARAAADPHRQKLLAKIPDIIAEDTGIGIHISGFGKGVQTTLRKQFDCQCHVRSFLFRLAEQLRMKVLQGRSLPLISAADVFPVDLGGTAVNDGLLLCTKTVAADKLLAQG